MKPTTNNNNKKPTGVSRPRNMDWKLIPNPYGIRVIIRERTSTYPTIEVLKDHSPYENLPFVILKRGYVKTLQNLLNDCIDMFLYSVETSDPKQLTIEEATQQSPCPNSKTKKFSTRVAFGSGDFGDKSLSLLDPCLLHEINLFNNIMDGVKMSELYGKFKSNMPNKDIRSFDLNGNPVIWVAEDDKLKYDIAPGYVIFDSSMLWHIINLVDMGIQRYEYSIHQRAAIRYIRAVLTKGSTIGPGDDNPIYRFRLL